jgi:hypothetical protein
MKFRDGITVIWDGDKGYSTKCISNVESLFSFYGQAIIE